MKFSEVVEHASALLQRKGRITYRALRREFDLDEEALEDLKAELIDAQRIATDEDGKVLVWTGQGSPASSVQSLESKTANLSNARRQTLDPRPISYTPKHLAGKILQSKSALEGERKQVTVLFADVKSSMELAEQLDPEEWHQILDRFFAILTDGVHRFEGTVNQYTGDGIMALFGAPIAHEDHAQRACYAALQLHEEITRYATEVKREHGVGFATAWGSIPAKSWSARSAMIYVWTTPPRATP
jgi:class 3 adenylate cyclase